MLSATRRAPDDFGLGCVQLESIDDDDVILEFFTDVN